MLAFSIGNILFSPLELNIGSFYSLLAVIWSVLFYGTSKYQGNRLGTIISILIGLSALVLELSIFFQLFILVI